MIQFLIHTAALARCPVVTNQFGNRFKRFPFN